MKNTILIIILLLSTVGSAQAADIAVSTGIAGWSSESQGVDFGVSGVSVAGITNPGILVGVDYDGGSDSAGGIDATGYALGLKVGYLPRPRTFSVGPVTSFGTAKVRVCASFYGCETVKGVYYGGGAAWNVRLSDRFKLIQTLEYQRIQSSGASAGAVSLSIGVCFGSR